MTPIRRNLIPALGLAAIASLIQGCTVYWDGMINNSSSNDITIIGDDKARTSWPIRAHEKVEITWKFKCLEVNDSGQSYFFEAGKAPKEAVHQSGVTFDVHLVYHDQQLHYLAGQTEQPLRKVDSCGALSRNDL
ncbi:MAG: hypothetical protein HPY82_07430 [Gammaproteobacteria bacterium]|nr:hypothetical protein [Gammaproteobacteria bacterium]